MEFGFNVGYLKKSWNVILLVIPFSDAEIFAGCTFHTASNRMWESEQDHPNLTTTGCIPNALHGLYIMSFNWVVQ